jgi:protein-tyrosine-phosphatase
MRIVFVCHGNTCRSLLAEHLARRRYPNVQFESIGIFPGSVNDTENAIYTLNRIGISVSSHQPRFIENVNLDDFDLVVAMDQSISQFLVRRGLEKPKLRTWEIPDPYGDNLGENERTARLISQELSKLRLDTIAERSV